MCPDEPRRRTTESTVTGDRSRGAPMEVGGRRLAGAYAPVPTPLDEVGELDLAALGRHLDGLAAAGLNGALILGTNGEFPSFTLAERRAVAEAAAKWSARAPKFDLLLGVGSCALPEAEELTVMASDMGYAAVLCPPPYYFVAAGREGLAAFLRQVLNRSGVPVLLYHIPQLTGVTVDDGLLDRLGDHPRLAGVKDSSGREDELARLVHRFAGGSYLVGHDRLISRCLEVGGTGSISAAANVVPDLVAAVHRDRSCQPQLDRLRALLDEAGLNPATKLLLRRQGLGRYGQRPPLSDLPPDRAERFLSRWDAALEAAGVSG